MRSVIPHSVCILFCVSLCGCIGRQERWKVAMSEWWPGLSESELLAKKGEPDLRLGFLEFVQRLDDGPGRYEDWVGRSVRRTEHIEFSSYRAYMLYRMVRYSRDLYEHGYDPNWYQATQYSNTTVLVYDESRRFDHPVWGSGFTVYIQLVREGRWVGDFQLDHWEPQKFSYPCPLRDRECLKGDATRSAALR